MAEKNGANPLLDLTELLPATGRIKAGDQYFTVNTDISPTLAGRVTRWFVRYQEAIQGEGDINEGELWVIVGVLLNIAPEEAQALGFPACLKLVAFLLKPLRELGRTIAL